MNPLPALAVSCALAAIALAQGVKPAPADAKFGPTVVIPDPFGVPRLSSDGAATGTLSLKQGSNVPDASGAVPRRDKNRGNDGFMAKHAAHLQRAKAGPIGLLFLGDSITERWSTAPETWEAHFARYQPANFGLGADETQHLLWRIDDGELDGIQPKVVVLLIGTLNTGANSAAQIAAAHEKIIRTIRTKLPETKVLLLGVFPRGSREGYDPVDGTKRAAVIRALNARLATFDDGHHVRFLDLGPKFLGTDGNIAAELMADRLHPTAAGYTVWAEAMQPLLDEMMR